MTSLSSDPGASGILNINGPVGPCALFSSDADPFFSGQFRRPDDKYQGAFEEAGREL